MALLHPQLATNKTLAKKGGPQRSEHTEKPAPSSRLIHPLAPLKLSLGLLGDVDHRDAGEGPPACAHSVGDYTTRMSHTVRNKTNLAKRLARIRGQVDA